MGGDEAAFVNTVVVVGECSADPVFGETRTGSRYTQVSLRVGKAEILVSAYGGAAEACERFGLREGSRVAVHGELRNVRRGEPTSLEVLAHRVVVLGE